MSTALPARALRMLSVPLRTRRQRYFSYSTVGLVVIALITLGLWISSRTYMSAVEWVDHSHKVQQDAAVLLQSLTDAETAQRGFLITRQDNYLRPYETARESAIAALLRMEAVTEDNPVQRQRIKLLQPVVEGKLAEMDNILELQRSKGVTAARQFLLEGSGLVLMDRIREMLSQFAAEEAALLAEREDQAATLSVLLLSGVVGFSFMLGGFMWFGLRQLEREQAMEKEHNQALAQALADQQALTEQREMLLNEVNHRVKNSLQQIAGMLRLQMRDMPEGDKARVALTEALSRIMAIGRVHEQMYRSEAVGEVKAPSFLEPVAREIFGTLLPGLDHGGAVLTMKVDAVGLPLEKAVPLALIVNELITNAVKYAHRPDKPCKLDIVFNFHGRNGCRMLVQDNGPGLPKDFKVEKARSLGMRLVQNLTRQLDGQVVIDSGLKGTRFEITVAEL